MEFRKFLAAVEQSDDLHRVTANVSCRKKAPNPTFYISIDKFQKDPDVRVALRNIIAGGVGITLF